MCAVYNFQHQAIYLKSNHLSNIHSDVFSAKYAVLGGHNQSDSD